MAGNYMRARQIAERLYSATMPGPWGKAIQRLRQAKGKTREAVAAKAKMTPTTYGRIERGDHTQTRKLQAIADAFSVPIELILIGTEERDWITEFWRWQREQTKLSAPAPFQDSAAIVKHAVDSQEWPSAPKRPEIPKRVIEQPKAKRKRGRR